MQPTFDRPNGTPNNRRPMHRPVPTAAGPMAPLRPAANIGPPPRDTGSRPKGAGTHIDYAHLVRNNLWLLVIGLAAGLGLGNLKFQYTEPMFRSSAKVQVVGSTVENLPVDALETGLSSRSLGDEALVIRSERILTRAAEIGQLSETEPFAGRTDEQIAGMLGGSQALVIQPAVDSGDTSVLQIQFDSTSPTTTKRVVDAIIDAYSVHLQSEYQDIGRETLGLIQTARNDVHEKLTQLEKEFAEFKKESALIYREDSTTSIHRENAAEYLKAQQALELERAHLTSILVATESAINDESPLESILLGLTLASNSPQLSPKALPDEARKRELKLQHLREVNQTTVSERMRQEKLLPLQIEREQLASSVGPDHPALVTLDQRISVITGAIDEIVLSEQEMRQKLDEVWQSASESEPDAVDTTDQDEQAVKDAIRTGVFALKQRLNSINEEARVLKEAYDREMAAAKENGDHEIRSAQLVREIERQQNLYDRIMERLDEVNLMSAGAGLKLFTLDSAKPGYQFAPSMMKSLLLGGFMGTMFMGAIALLREVSDQSYHSPRELAEHLGFPVIGHIPALKPHRGKKTSATDGSDPLLCTVANQRGRECEAFRAIRTAIFFSDQASDTQVLQVTSATPGDGKSMVSSNLAVSIAQSGRSVLLIDADMRRNRINEIFAMKCERGLAWAIDQVRAAETSGKADSGELVYRAAIQETGVPNLSVMLAGSRPKNPSELLSSWAFESLLTSLRHKFDVIIVDTPPLLAVSDPCNVVRRADGVLLVVRLHKHVKPDVARASQILDTLRANVVGVVVNGVGSRQAGWYRDSNESMPFGQRQVFRNGYGYSYSPVNDEKYGEYYDEADEAGEEPSAPQRNV